MQDPISVLLVDDHAVVREGLRAFFDTQPDLTVVGEAASGEEAIDLATELVPDVVLMDLVMPGMDGVEATLRIKRVTPRTQVIVLTSYHEDEHIFPALRAGALSYMLKDTSMDELSDTVRRAARGEASLHPLVASRVIQDLQRGGHVGSDEFLDLTNRELEILRLIAQGLSNADLVEELVISENTVKGHVSNVLSKLHLANRTQAAVYAWREGLVRRG